MRLRSAAVLFALALPAAAAACGSDPEELPTATDAGAKDAGGRDASPADTGAGPARDPDAWCAALGGKQDRCDGQRECGLDFATWCPKQAQTNSYAFEKADTACLTTTCDVTERSICRYGKYRAEDLTAAQKALATAYCQSCAPSAVDGCVQGLFTYDPATKGGVSDAFVAVWELSDALTNEIRTTCTGKPTPAGSTCPKAFAGCAADVYLNGLPACK